MLGPLLFEVYCSPIADFIAYHSVHRQYADDTQLHLAMSADNTPAGLSIRYTNLFIIITTIIRARTVRLNTDFNHSAAPQ